MQNVEYMTLTKAREFMAAGGKAPSTCTLWRWCRKGCRGVYLKYYRFGREIRVTQEDMADFAARLGAADAPVSRQTKES